MTLLSLFGLFNLTKVSVVCITELSPPTKAQVKGQLIRSPQFAAVVDGCEGIVHVVERDEAIVVAVGTKYSTIYRHNFSVFFLSDAIHHTVGKPFHNVELCILTLFL